MWNGRTIYRAVIRLTYMPRLDGSVQEIHSVGLLATEMPGNKATPISKRRPMTWPIRQPKPNHNALVFGRAGRVA